MPDSPRQSPDSACNTPDPRSSYPNLPGHTPDFSYSLISSTLFSSSSPISLFLMHNSTIIAEHNVKSSISISPFHDSELTLCMPYTKCNIHRVQHTLCTAYPEFSTPRVQHPLRNVFFSIIVMITSGPLNVVSACGVPPYKIHCHHPARYVSPNAKSRCHIPISTSQLTDG